MRSPEGSVVDEPVDAGMGLVAVRQVVESVQLGFAEGADAAVDHAADGSLSVSVVVDRRGGCAVAEAAAVRGGVAVGEERRC